MPHLFSPKIAAFLCLSLTSLAASLHATYSIVACDAATGQCGVAVQTDNLAVGASVPFAQAGVGAIASQYETNPHHGPRGLALLAAGGAPSDVLRKLLEEDGQFEGRGIEARQVAIVSVDGRAAVHTGADAAHSRWAGSRSGNGFSVQGNGLAGPQVLVAMEEAFLSTPGQLAERLLAALAAGDRAGGQRTGRESAVLLVRTRDGYPYDIDLRVDDAPDPVSELRRIFDLQSARQQIITARIDGVRGNFNEARSLLIGAVAHAATWPRGCVDAAKVAINIEEPDLALQYLSLAFARSPSRIPSVIGDGDFASLGGQPAFHRWVDDETVRQALEMSRALADAKGASTDDRLSLAAKLLEAGRPSEAFDLIEGASPSELSVRRSLLRASALEDLGRRDEAASECRNTLKRSPGDVRMRQRLALLVSAAIKAGENAVQ
ncbi:MAG TPA: DUF1028 domain-containing protein [Opitutaceae bacterium]